MASTAGPRSRLFDLVLDKHSMVPLYLQLKHHIVHLISSGEYPPGTPLPSVRQVSTTLGLATATVQRTYGELQAQGLLVGQSGRGVFVAKLTAGLPALASERSDLLRDLVARTVAQARSFGFKDEEILAAVSAGVRGSSLRGAPPAPRLVLVSRFAEFAEKYRSSLAEALGVTVESILLVDLEERGDALLDELEPVTCLVCLVSTFPDLRRLAGHRGTPLYGLVVDLMEETQHELVQLPPDVPLGLVAEDHYLPSARALVRQYRGTEEGLVWAGHHNRSALRRILRDCPIIIHTLGSKRLLEGQAPRGTQLLELRYRPNPASLARLRSLVIAAGEQTPSPQVGAGSTRPAVSPDPTPSHPTPTRGGESSTPPRVGVGSERRTRRTPVARID